MKVNDLRIGNWIMFRNSETGLFENDLPIVEVQELLYLEDGTFEAEPIPLTEEWLIRLGFYQTTKKFNFIGFREYIYFNSNVTPRNWSIKLWSSELKSKEHKNGKYLWAKVEIKYVHQLQNLYFALTCEELTIKNK